MKVADIQNSYGTWTATFLGEKFESRRQQEALNWLTTKRSELVIATTPRMGVFDGYRHKGVSLMRDTIEVFDKLTAKGWHPADCGNGMITMEPYQFKKSFGGRPATRVINRNYVMLSVWVGHVEITCMEQKNPSPLTEVIVPCTESPTLK